MKDLFAILSSTVVLLLSIAGCSASNPAAVGASGSAGSQGGSVGGGSSAQAAGEGGTDDSGTNGEATAWPIADGGNGHRYLLVTVPSGITWTDANEAATAAGGHLLTISSAAENAFVLALFKRVTSAWADFPPSTTYLGPWLGASAQAGDWSWVTSEPFEYTDWIGGQPSGTSNTGEIEDKLQWLAVDEPVAAAVIGWNDATDWAGPSYVIEFE